MAEHQNFLFFSIWETQILIVQHCSSFPGESESASCSVMSNSATPWTVAHQAPLSVGFFRQEYWSELPFPSPGALPDSGIKSGSPALQADSLPSEPPGKP